MKNKKGFTLVELLAVIAILAILVIIALPNVMGMFNEAKKSSFTTEVKEVYKVAQQEWMMDSMTTTGDQVYTRCKTCTGKSLQLSGRSELDYYIKIDKSGKITEYYATDGTYQYKYNGGELNIESIKDIESVSSLDEDNILVIANNSVNVNTNANKFCVIFDSTTKYYDYSPGSTWSSYLSSSLNTEFSEYHPHGTNRGIVSTTAGAPSYCGTDIFFNNVNVPISSTIINSTSGCYTYRNAGIC